MLHQLIKINRIFYIIIKIRVFYFYKQSKYVVIY